MPFTPYDETQKALQSSFQDFPRLNKKVSLMEAFGCIISKDIIAKDASPKYPTSSMDGYAIRFEDQQLKKLKIIDILPAGNEAVATVDKGSCIKTFTGSLMSSGSDTLIPIENVEVQNGYIIIKSEISFGFAVRKIGENYSSNEILIRQGTKLGYCEIGILAELGYAHVEVVSPPRIGVIATGSEIVDIGESLENDSKIRSSNHILLAGLSRHWGAEAILFPILRDNKELIRKTIQEALTHCDIVVTTGGVSVGDFDYVRDIINEYGVAPLINGAAIKPGRHVRILKFGEKYLCSFPGFPYSAAVTFRLYAVPIILHYLGLDTRINYNYGYLKVPYKRRSKFSEFVSCCTYEEKGQILIDFQEQRSGSSAILNNLLNNTPLLVVPENIKSYNKDECVPLIKMVP